MHLQLWEDWASAFVPSMAADDTLGLLNCGSGPALSAQQ
jgi:hypothetical protein